MSTIKLSKSADGVALITIDLPERPINVFTSEFVTDLEAVVDEVHANPAIKGAVITSGKKSFIAGADLKEILESFDLTRTPAEAATYFAKAGQLMRKIESGGKPFAAAINGHALGGGFELCLACHYRIVADDSDISLGLPEVNVGLLPGGGGTQRLPRLIGVQKALPLLLGGSSLKPAEALSTGIIDAVVNREQLVQQASDWVLAHPDAKQPWDIKGFKVPGGTGPLAPHANRSFAEGMAKIRSKTQDNYPAPLAILAAVYEGTQLPIEHGLRIEAKYFGTLLVNPVARNLIRTMFVNRGLCDKLIGRPEGIAKTSAKEIGVVGAGMMGAGIAYAAAAAGVEVILIDMTQESAEKGQAYAKNLLTKDVEKGRFSQEKADAVLGRIRATTDWSALSNCELVIEAVFESRSVKKEVIERLDQVLSPQAILASNTSTISISSLADYAQRPEKVIGLHFFSPVERMPLVEVIKGAKTAPETLAGALDFVAQLRKTPIVVNDSPGFYTSRIFCAYIDEGIAMVDEGVNPALIENAARTAGMAAAPLAVVDEVSLDLQKKVIDQAIADGLPEKFLREHAQPVVRKLNEIGRLGRKSGGGFYDFPVGEKKRLWGDLQSVYPLSDIQPLAKVVEERLMYIQALEAARCIEEGVIGNPMYADIGSVLGLGFPTWTGGPISFIDTVELPRFIARCEELAAAYGKRFSPSKWLVERASTGQRFYETARS